jgi:predicted MFS family arabinose efflux permease
LEALRFAAAEPVLRAVLVSTTLLVGFAGVDNVALVFLIRDTLGGGSFAYGLAMAFFGAGMLVATVLVVRFKRWGAERLLFTGTLASAVATALLGIVTTLGAVYPVQMIGGAGNGLDVAVGTTLIQQRTPPGMLGRMAGASQMGVAIGFLLAYLGGGALVEATSPRTTFLIAGAGSLLAVAMLIPLLLAPRTARG